MEGKGGRGSVLAKKRVRSQGKTRTHSEVQQLASLVDHGVPRRDAAPDRDATRVRDARSGDRDDGDGEGELIGIQVNAVEGGRCLVCRGEVESVDIVRGEKPHGPVPPGVGVAWKGSLYSSPSRGGCLEEGEVNWHLPVLWDAEGVSTRPPKMKSKKESMRDGRHQGRSRLTVLP